MLFAAIPARRANAQSNLERQEKHIINLTKSSWAHFRDYNGRQLIYFTGSKIDVVRIVSDNQIVDGTRS